MNESGWTYLTAPENLWAKVEDNGVEKEVRVVAVGINPNTPEAMDKDDGSNTVLLIAEPDSRWDRELKQQWHALAQVHRLFFRRRRRIVRQRNCLASPTLGARLVAWHAAGADQLGYQLRPRETVSSGIKRIALEQIDEALARLADSDGDLD